MNKKWLLYLTGFFSGMSVMAIELGASRLLAPYFSSSQIVWTIVIATIMIAMAIGNVVGGKMADKRETPTKLFVLLFFAAVWTALIPFLGKFIIAGVALVLALFVSSNYLIWAALVSCLLVFVFPLLILGMVTPNLVKYAVKDIANSGKTVGVIEALNTIGSIIGTFLPTFVTIPYVGTTITFVLFASIIFIICLVYFILLTINNKNKGSIIKTSVFGGVAILIITIGSISNMIGTAFWDRSILYEGESIYNYLRVEETDDSIILSTNVLFGVQSVKMKERGLTGLYYDYALASPVISGACDKEIDVLILGLGTGTFATQCYEYFDNVNISGVEIDKSIVDLSYKYFDLSKDVDVHINDGRAYLNSIDKKYDVIMVDAYQDITIPFQMSSIEFFRLVKEHLNDNGNMVVNMNMYSEAEGGINDYLSGTIKKVFSNVYISRTNGTNLELFASSNYDPKEKLSENIGSIENTELRNMMTTVLNRFDEVEDNGYVLTDDKAPVEVLGMRVLDDMIIDELAYYKNRFKNMSFKEMIKLLMSGELF